MTPDGDLTAACLLKARLRSLLSQEAHTAEATSPALQHCRPRPCSKPRSPARQPEQACHVQDDLLQMILAMDAEPPPPPPEQGPQQRLRSLIDGIAAPCR